MNTFCLVLGILFLASAQNALPQQTLPGRGDFHIEFDAARFFGDGDRIFVEMYYGIAEDALTYALDSGRYTGAAIVKYIVRADSGIVATKEWRVPHTLDDSVRFHKSQIMTGLESVALLPGTHTISLIAYDGRDSQRSDSIDLVIPVQQFPTDKETFSDIELCTMIRSSTDQQSIFYKNTLEIIPNPGRMFGVGLPILYYYAEVYNLAAGQSQSAMTIHSAVVDATGKEVVVRDKTKPRLHEASVEVGTMNLSALRGGTYSMRVSLLDSLRGVITSTEKKFFIYKPGTILDSTDLNATDLPSNEYAFMTEADVDREAAYIRYILGESEQSQYEALTVLKAKQQFLSDFWKRRDEGTASGVSVGKKDYFKRIETANRSFSSGSWEGWKTDRGRVYVLYGPYDEVERFPNSAESSPYEIWHYNSLQGGVIFVFVDRNDLGDYMLVHSTHRDELHEENWYQTYALKAR